MNTFPVTSVGRPDMVPMPKLVPTIRRSVLSFQALRLQALPKSRVHLPSEDWIARTWRQQKHEAKLNEGWARPKGMRSRTRERIVAAIIHCEGLARYLDRLGWAY